MTKPRRNDPCPCGSGKKHKKCCLISEADTEFQFRRFQRTHAEIIPKLTEFAFGSISPELFEQAWKDFNDREQVEPFDPQSPMNVLFMPWFLFNWIVELKPPGSRRFTETTIAEQFLVNHQGRLASDEKTLLLSSIRRPYTLCEVIEVRPGSGMTLFDLLRRIKIEVVERAASLTLKRGEIIYCATSEVLGFSSNVGTGPYALRPTEKLEVLNLRKWIISQIGDEQIKPEQLHEFEYDIRALYLDVVKAMFSPPRLTNTDNHQLLPQKLYFDLESASDAFHSLKDLAVGWSEDELLKDATIMDGVVVKAEVPWLGGSEAARRRLDGPVLLGLLKIDRDRLVVEVNSKERAECIRKLIQERLRNRARYKNTLIEPLESRFNEILKASATGAILQPGGAKGEAPSGFISLDDAQPELRAMMAKISRQHWNSWFDLPIPALNNMTPREAAKSEEGRDLLESLLLFYESSKADSSDNLYSADIPALRRELEMD